MNPPPPTPPPFPSRVFGSAEISPCGQYRYELMRSWDAQRGACAFIMLNPSTADAADDDPTIRRCIGFANRWGYGELRVYNLFGLRSSDPEKLINHSDPHGPRNAEFLERAGTCSKVVCAWGSFSPETAMRGLALAKAMTDRGVRLYALAVNQDGQPRHPLYVKSTTEPALWRHPAQ